MRSVCFGLALLLAMIFSSSASAGVFGLGAGRFASKVNRTGGIYHAANYRGAEVVYRSSGRATRAQAKAAWRRSPGHNALLSAGKIKRIRCRGNVCVGRG
jgi:hypothetical protein